MRSDILYHCETFGVADQFYDNVPTSMFPNCVPWTHFAMDE